MKKVLISVLLSLLCVGSAFSQFDAQLSQYMLDLTSYNPAAVGEGDMIHVTGHIRSQWMGMDSIEKSIGGLTSNISISTPLRIGNSMHGIGVRLLKDQMGLFTNQTVYLQYAFKKRLGNSTLSIGMDVGAISLGFAGTKLSKITLGTYHKLLEDQYIPQADVNGTSLDLNAGVFYSTPTYYAGLSFTHITSPVVAWSDKADMKVTGTAYLTGGYQYALPDTKYVLKPSGLIKTDFNSFQVDLSGRMEYDNKFWGGLSYRFQDAVVVLAGLNIDAGLSIGLSYDLSTSKMITATKGSGELVVTYNFAYLFDKKNSKYKSIRIL
jgi:type IX secretion system PorP/SprF family membrane protein